MNLLPNTTYYLWFVNNGAWSDRSDLSSATVSVSGSYGTAGRPSASDGQFGRAIPISISGHSAGARFTVKASCAGNTETLLNNSAATSLSWTPAVATYAPLITDAASAAATITVETYYGSSKLYTESTSITVSWAAGTIPPTVSSGWASAAPLNEGAAAGFTVWIQRYSRARVSFTPSLVTTRYGAAIRSFSVKLDGTSYPAVNDRADTGVIMATSANLLCTVTDSRGQTASETLALTLYPYSRPSLSGVRVFRCDAAGAANEDSTYVSAKATANISSLGGENSVSLRLWTRKRGESWGGSVALSSGVERILSGIDPDSSYEIWIQADDALGGQAIYSQILPTRVWAMKFRPDGSGVAFGKAAEYDGVFEITEDWDFRVHGKEINTLLQEKLLSLVYPVGSIYMSVNNESPATFLGGTWEQIEDTFLLAAGSSFAAGATGGAATHHHSTAGHTLTVSEIPSHTHGVQGWRYNNQSSGDKWSTSYTKLSDSPSSSTPVLATGGGRAHNHGDTGDASSLPPYLAVYMWKRTG